jgi:hypothetical protein
VRRHGRFLSGVWYDMGDSSGWLCGGSATRAHSAVVRAMALHSTCGAGLVEWEGLIYQNKVKNCPLKRSVFLFFPIFFRLFG